MFNLDDITNKHNEDHNRNCHMFQISRTEC